MDKPVDNDEVLWTELLLLRRTVMIQRALHDLQRAKIKLLEKGAGLPVLTDKTAEQEPIAQRLLVLADECERNRKRTLDPVLERIYLHMREAYQHAATVVRTAEPA